MGELYWDLRYISIYWALIVSGRGPEYLCRSRPTRLCLPLTPQATLLVSCHQSLFLTGEPYFTIILSNIRLVRKSIPKKLTHAQQVLAARSAVPARNALLLRPTADNAAIRRAQVTHREKVRLLRIARRPTNGRFNLVAEKSSSERPGLAVNATARVGAKDVWSEDKEAEFLNGLREGDQRDYLPELVMKPQIKVGLPISFLRHTFLCLNAISYSFPDRMQRGRVSR